MKYIKNNKVYDTEISVHIGGYTDFYYFDFCCLTENLYQTPDETYFLIREGYTPSDNRVGISQHTKSDRGKISILTKRESIQWTEQHRIGRDFEDFEEKS